MTFEEFDNTKWRHNLFVNYCDVEHVVISVNSTERLLEILYKTNPIWVRCENVELKRYTFSRK